MTQHSTNFELKHQSESEPWNYSDRGAEILRHEWVTRMAQSYDPQGVGVLDVGCSFGQLSQKLLEQGLKLVSMDLSSKAVARTQQLLDQARERLPDAPKAWVFQGSATSIPFPNSTFQVVLFSDGLEGWELKEQQKLQALREAFRVLRPGGVAILTDFMHPRVFPDHLRLISRGPLRIEKVDYLNDRLWFQLNTNLRGLSSWKPVRSILKSVSLARGLARISACLGPRGSKHIAVLLRKET